MNKAFTIAELFVVILIIAITTGMLIPAINMVRNSAIKAQEASEAKKKGTEATKDTWKMSDNMTPSGAVCTYIITDPVNNQKWIVVQRGSSCSIIPYVPTPVTPEVAQ